MIPEPYSELWRKIESFVIDDPSAPVKFSDKLAASNQWTAVYTARVIREYKRFIFLCCLSPSGASPSEAVDEAWHLHLTYTENYWKKFCGETIGREIHHHPSKGGSFEQDRHRNWYEESLKLYRETFDEEAPSDIWPHPVPPPDLFPEAPAPEYGSLYRNKLWIFLLPFAYPFVFGKMHPYALKGPQFLIFYPLLVVAALLLLWIVGRQKKQLMHEEVDRGFDGNANLFQLSRFIYGRSRTLQAAVVDLMSCSVLVSLNKKQFEFNRSKASQANAQNPLFSRLMQSYDDGAVLTMDDLSACYDDSSTWHGRLSGLYQQLVIKDPARLLLPAAAVIIALARIVQGEIHGQPTLYLIVELIVSIFVFAAVDIAFSSKKLLQQIFTEKYQREELMLDEQSSSARFVFYGMAALGGLAAYHYLPAIFQDHRTSTAGTSSSCGGTSCGSSCGSSCGGGGCGGCGGGD